jgi:hypothetical protein
LEIAADWGRVEPRFSRATRSFQSRIARRLGDVAEPQSRLAAAGRGRRRASRHSFPVEARLAAGFGLQLQKDLGLLGKPLIANDLPRLILVGDGHVEVLAVVIEDVHAHGPGKGRRHAGEQHRQVTSANNSLRSPLRRVARRCGADPDGAGAALVIDP